MASINDQSVADADKMNKVAHSAIDIDDVDNISKDQAWRSPTSWYQ
jgi:hypothetical protein